MERRWWWNREFDFVIWCCVKALDCGEGSWANGAATSGSGGSSGDCGAVVVIVGGILSSAITWAIRSVRVRS